MTGDRKPAELVSLIGGRCVHVDTPMFVNTIITAVEEKYG